MTSLQGNRIYLRLLEEKDAEVVLKGVNEPEGSKLTGTHATFTLEQIEGYIANNSIDDSRAGWLICLLDHTVIGEVVINDIDEDNQSANIRIALFDPQYFGQGYGTEAMHLALKYAFEIKGLHRISLGVYDFNPRAIRVYEKVGFQQEGVLRDALLWEGEFHDEIIMSILAYEWETFL